MSTVCRGCRLVRFRIPPIQTASCEPRSSAGSPRSAPLSRRPQRTALRATRRQPARSAPPSTRPTDTAAASRPLTRPDREACGASAEVTATCDTYAVPAGLAQASRRSGIALRPLQPPQRLQADGTLRNSASLAKVQPEWRPVVDAAVEACRSVLGEHLVSVYLRGSIPQGAAVAGLSDCDCLVYYSDWAGDRRQGLATPTATRLVQQELRARAAGVAALHPFCTKLELQAFPLRAADGWRSALQQPVAGANGGIPTALAQRLPRAFDAAACAVCVCGDDFAARLPAAARVPRPEVLPRLSQSIARAEEAVAEAAPGPGGGGGDAVRAARWALKAVLRAAFEVVAEEAGVHTRDLYWCCALACQGLPALEAELVEALAMYVRLSGAREGDAREEAAVLAEARQAASLAHDTARRVLTAYWVQRLSWSGAPDAPLRRALAGLPLRAWDAAAGAPRSQAPAQPSGPCAVAQRLAVWGRRTAQQLYLEALLLARPGDMQPGASKHAAQATWAPPAELSMEAVQVLDCGPLSGGTASPHCVREALASGAPVLFRGAAASWPALRKWSVRYLARKGGAGTVRVAPSPEFPFCEPALHGVLVGLLGHAAAPSNVATMRCPEFFARLMGAVPPLFYPRGEHYYMQADLNSALLDDVDFTVPPFLDVLPGGRDGAPQQRTGSAGPRQGERQWAQPPRMWVSAEGSVSPAHFDNSPSILTQVCGAKRMLFWSPDDLAALRPFPDDHLLRRRCRLPEAPPGCREALLQPGDVVYFPPKWAHYTESLSYSVSVTARTARPPATPTSSTASD